MLLWPWLVLLANSCVPIFLAHLLLLLAAEQDLENYLHYFVRCNAPEETREKFKLVRETFVPGFHPCLFCVLIITRRLPVSTITSLSA